MHFGFGLCLKKMASHFSNTQSGSNRVAMYFDAVCISIDIFINKDDIFLFLNETIKHSSIIIQIDASLLINEFQSIRF